MARRFSFDEQYYQRYYRAANSPDDPGSEIARLGTFVTAYLAHMKLHVARVLDLGCGVGNWRSVIARAYPRASYTGVEYSAYLCEKLGWIRGSVVDFSSDQPFDLVICQGVLQYLPAADARRAIVNMGRLSRGAVYLEALTRKDWEDNCDREHTDGKVYLRTGEWYRKELAPHFVNCGGGVFLVKESPIVLYELEAVE